MIGNYCTSKLKNLLAVQLEAPLPMPITQRIVGHQDWFIYCTDWVYKEHIVPKFFISDFDSIPKIPFLYGWLKGKTTAAAGLHDLHYATGIVSRERADQVFYDLMVLEGVDRLSAYVIYKGVRWFGAKRYKRKNHVWTTLMGEMRNVEFPFETSVR